MDNFNADENSANPSGQGRGDNPTARVAGANPSGQSHGANPTSLWQSSNPVAQAFRAIVYPKFFRITEDFIIRLTEDGTPRLIE